MPVTAVVELTVNLQGLVVEQIPPPLPKAMNLDPLLGVAVSITVVPAGYCMQLAPQEAPAGAAVTWPLPFPT